MDDYNSHFVCVFQETSPQSTSQEVVNSFGSISANNLAVESAVPSSAVQDMVMDERSASPPLPPSSASSGFSDDDSLHFDDGRGYTLEEFARHVREKGKQNLYLEYAEIKSKGTEGTFNNARYCLFTVLYQP